MSFPNENGGGGFGFDFTNSTSDPGPAPPMSVGSGSGGSDAGDVAKTVVFFFLTGVGIIIGLVVLVYLISVVMDRFCCCLPGFQPIIGGATQQLDNGPVAHKAGLAGLTLRDRRAILDRLLVGMPYTADMAHAKAPPDEPPDELEPGATASTELEGATIPQGNGESDDPGEAPPDGESAKAESKVDENPVETVDVENAAVSKSTKENDATTDKESEATDDSAEQPKTEAAGKTKEAAAAKPGDDIDDDDHNTTCAICLNEYDEGEIVLRGRKCQHMFHRECALEWLEKHDHCPFCRKEMMTPAEFRDTAVELFGEERITQLSMWGRGAYRRRRRSRSNNNNNNSDDHENASLNDSDADEEVGSSIFRDSNTADESQPDSPQPTATVPAS